MLELAEDVTIRRFVPYRRTADSMLGGASLDGRNTQFLSTGVPLSYRVPGPVVIPQRERLEDG
jgi:hypothetical protein